MLKREILEGVDIMVVCELTGDVYFGKPKRIDVIDGELGVLFLYSSVNRFHFCPYVSRASE